MRVHPKIIERPSEQGEGGERSHKIREVPTFQRNFPVAKIGIWKGKNRTFHRGKRTIPTDLPVEPPRGLLPPIAALDAPREPCEDLVGDGVAGLGKSGERTLFAPEDQDGIT